MAACKSVMAQIPSIELLSELKKKGVNFEDEEDPGSDDIVNQSIVN